MAINNVAQKRYGWHPNDYITSTVEVPTLQFYNASGNFQDTSNLIDLQKENLDLSKLTINNDSNSFPVKFGYQEDNKIKEYYQLANVELLIPTSDVDASDWDMNLTSDITGVSLPKLFETNPTNPQ
ncbi:hypothetical protein P344_05330 [Spiroplasma mirum ATCC 29335]|uniref:Uncharacterized protein n=1 Tax=Spiroplasma mirum ATCC 29335 TaxID=838561 RepID=W0GM04_9MOLU|nr:MULTISPECIES: hypothetical protein [Spiroplasma]AHF61285.1 hypothetical protein SMM_0895 [Spiroplasma mirum ATCC 29335]AHI58388.1 hypothetical protein P344_05330 [Spiroplasma mirum ATCC 29335]